MQEIAKKHVLVFYFPKQKKLSAIFLYGAAAVLPMMRYMQYDMVLMMRDHHWCPCADAWCCINLLCFLLFFGFCHLYFLIRHPPAC